MTITSQLPLPFILIAIENALYSCDIRESSALKQDIDDPVRVVGSLCSLLYNLCVEGKLPYQGYKR